MLDYQDYSIDGNGHQGNGNGNGNGYDRLQGDWALFYKVAKGFTCRVRPEDRQDFLHDLFLTMAQVKSRYTVIKKELTEAGLIRVACYEVAQYWRMKYRRINGHDCSRCSNIQRRRCKEDDSFRKCPKAIRTDSLDRLIEDGEGNQIELHQMIADDSAIDIAARLDARLTLQSYPHRFIKIAYKKYAGYPLNHEERNYLYRQRHKALRGIQKQLIFAGRF